MDAREEEDAATFAFTTILSNLRSKINQTEMTFWVAVDSLSIFTLYGKRDEKIHLERSQHLHKGVACCTQENVSSQNWNF